VRGAARMRDGKRGSKRGKGERGSKRNACCKTDIWLVQKKPFMFSGVILAIVGFMSSVQARKLQGVILFLATTNHILQLKLWIYKERRSCFLMFKLSLVGLFVENLGSSLWMV